MLTDEQLQRYSRQILLAEIDLEGQEKLSQASVLIIGAGGLGNPAALYLAGAGVKKIVLVDGDQLEVSNLHRQIGFREAQAGENKALALKSQLLALNSDVLVEAHACFADQPLLDTLVPDVTLVLDCSDNFATRSLVNRVCVEKRKPLVSGAAIRMEGQLAVFDLRSEDSPCYACLYGEGEGVDTLCSQSGVAGPVVGIVGAMQALQAIKLVCDIKLENRLALFDGKTLNWQSLAFRRDPACPVCATRGNNS